MDKTQLTVFAPVDRALAELLKRQRPANLAELAKQHIGKSNYLAGINQSQSARPSLASGLTWLLLILKRQTNRQTPVDFVCLAATFEMRDFKVDHSASIFHSRRPGERTCLAPFVCGHRRRRRRRRVCWKSFRDLIKRPRDETKPGELFRRRRRTLLCNRRRRRRRRPKSKQVNMERE